MLRTRWCLLLYIRQTKTQWQQEQRQGRRVVVLCLMGAWLSGGSRSCGPG